MRHRLPILMSLSCALLLAVPAFAQDAAAPAAPAETTKAAAAAKPAAKPAAPATADAAIKAIDAQIAKAAPRRTEAGWQHQAADADGGRRSTRAKVLLRTW